jgi:hypothetical protein
MKTDNTHTPLYKQPFLTPPPSNTITTYFRPELEEEVFLDLDLLLDLSPEEDGALYSPSSDLRERLLLRLDEVLLLELERDVDLDDLARLDER